MRRKWVWIFFLLAAAAEICLLVWVRGEYRTVLAEGKTYVTPVTVNFNENFYEKNYIPLHVPVDKTQWNSQAAPAEGEEVYLAVAGGKNQEMQVLRAQLEPPQGDWILVRAKRLDGDVLHFDFPADRLYMNAADIRKISITELAERVQVKNPDTGRVETRMKNALTAKLRVKDGRVVIEDLLVNGSPATAAYATVGQNADVKYAASGKEKDEVLPMGRET